MQFTKWKDVAKLVGLGAIVASLVFVSLQLRQGQEIALATQYQARAEATQELVLAHLEASYVPPIPALRRGAEKGVPAEDINTMLWLWIQMDNHYYQYQAGYLPQDSWEAQLRTTLEMYQNCEMRFVYDWHKNGLQEDFVNLVANFDDPCVGRDQ